MRELGVGNGGRVVLAIHDASGVPVAIKYLANTLFADKTFLTRFRVEARLLAGIRDPHLVRFYEYVESGSGAAIIMELVDGITLRELLRREGPIWALPHCCGPLGRSRRAVRECRYAATRTVTRRSSRLDWPGGMAPPFRI
jgi:serine/threonine protein kinase